MYISAESCRAGSRGVGEGGWRDVDPPVGLKQCSGTPWGAGGATLAAVTALTRRRCELKCRCKFTSHWLYIGVSLGHTREREPCGASQRMHAWTPGIARTPHVLWLSQPPFGVLHCSDLTSTDLHILVHSPRAPIHGCPRLREGGVCGHRHRNLA